MKNLVALWCTWLYSLVVCKSSSFNLCWPSFGCYTKWISLSFLPHREVSCVVWCKSSFVSFLLPFTCMINNRDNRTHALLYFKPVRDTLFSFDCTVTIFVYVASGQSSVPSKVLHCLCKIFIPCAVVFSKKQNCVCKCASKHQITKLN